jgi:hypothetical protein
MLMALAARLWGIGWQLPAALYFDELKYVAWAGSAKGDASAAVTDLRNPTLFHHLLQAEYAVAAGLWRGASEQETAVLELWLARVTSAVLGALACLLTALTAGELVRGPGDRGPRSAAWAGLAAGLILALVPLHVHLSHYAVNDASASLFLAATLLFGTRALVGCRRRSYLLAGLAAGLAFSTKYNFAVGLVLPLYAALAVPLGPLSGPRGAGGARRLGDLGHELGRRATWLLLVLAGLLLGAIVGAPEIVLNPGAVVAGVAEQARLGSIRWNGQSDAPVSQLYAETLVQSLGWPALVAAGIGAVALSRKGPAALMAQLMVPLVCLVVMLRQELFFARFALPLLPSLAILAGLGVAALADVVGAVPARPRPGRGRRQSPGAGRADPAMLALAPALALALVLLPVVATTVRHNQLATTTDTRVLARRWLRQRGEGARAAAELYSQPLLWAGSETPRGFRLLRVGTFADPAMVERLACDGTRYFLVASLTAERETARRSGRSGDSGYDVLAREGRVVATFDPYRPGMWVPAHPDNTAIPFWHAEAFARPGPKIAVYELPEGAVACPGTSGEVRVASGEWRLASNEG